MAQDSEEFVKLLISKGADVNVLSGQGFSPLYSVCRSITNI
jgi:hypothetical protein